MRHLPVIGTNNNHVTFLSLILHNQFLRKSEKDMFKAKLNYIKGIVVKMQHFFSEKKNKTKQKINNNNNKKNR